VAALSAGIPPVALSWHPKYRDIMRMYGLERYVYDSGSEASLAHLLELFEELSWEYDKRVSCLRLSQTVVLSRVQENGRVFANLIREFAK
jgi:polysaccharide pyruvyl transferase WcaK-like protein